MNLTDLAPKAEQAESFLKALANRHRLMILCELHKGKPLSPSCSERSASANLRFRSIWRASAKTNS